MRQLSKGHREEPPVLLVKWYDVTRWLLERVDSFPQNQRFIFGRRRPAGDLMERFKALSGKSSVNRGLPHGGCCCGPICR